jgi:hypothetical protein
MRERISIAADSTFVVGDTDVLNRAVRVTLGIRVRRVDFV